MNSIASTLSNVAARFCRGGFGQIQSYLLRGYRWLAAVLLGTVLLSAVGYGIVTVTYLLNSRWIAPLVLAKSDTRVAALAAQIFTAKQNRDAIKGELDSADQGRHLLQAQHDWLSDIIGRYERSLEFEKKADGKLNDRLKQLITNKRVVDAKTADMVAANRKLSAGIDQELQAGLITADTAMASKAQLVSSEAALSAGEIGTATLDHQISQLTRGVNSLAGGNSSPQALQNLAQLGVLKQELSDTDLKLARLNADVAAKSRQIGELDALLGSLTGSPFYMAAYGEKDVHRFAFVPYDNEGVNGTPELIQFSRHRHFRFDTPTCSVIAVPAALSRWRSPLLLTIFSRPIRLAFSLVAGSSRPGLPRREHGAIADRASQQ